MIHHAKPLHLAAASFHSRLQAVCDALSTEGLASGTPSRVLGGVCLAMAACFLLCAVPAAAAEPLPPFRIDTSLPQDIVVNAEQGLGQCHWVDPAILSLPYVSWAYDAGEMASGWATVEPQPGIFDWTALDAEVNKAHDLGKHIWLELLTTEGQTPQWARDAGVVVVGSRGGTPLPWNETYQRLLRRAVHAMAARYDDDPTVDAINVMAGGCYGEMAICANEADAAAWEQAGYTDEAFIEAAKQLIDIYLEDEYQWEDGSRSHGFRHTPVVLQLGSGLYGHTAAVIQPVVEYAVSKYGMRVWLKFNGLGGEYDMGWLYPRYDTATRVGYEPSGTSPDLMMQPRDYVQTALEQHASYLCLQDMYFSATEQQWQEARELAARYLGTQIVLRGLQGPEVVNAGQEYSFVTNWTNRGTVPLMRAQRLAAKDVPASYDIWLGFVSPTNGATAYEQAFSPSVPTTKWYSGQPIQIEQLIPIPVSLAPGEYDLQVALVNPDLPLDDNARNLRLVNTALDDGTGRYAVGKITVRAPIPVPTATATSEATPPESVSTWLGRVWRTLLQLLRRLFR
jgi:hypothetical protein